MAVMDRHWGLLGVPSSAGASTPGLDKGPAAVRAAGLVEGLRRSGQRVDDHGDVAGFRWRPDPAHPGGQNARAVTAVAAATATAVEQVVSGGRIPLVVGGDCTITIGVVAEFARAGTRAGLLYVDGGPDLYVPGTAEGGHLDSTGLAHMMDLPGCDPSLACVGPTTPLLTPARVVSYGDCIDSDDDPELKLLTELSIRRVTADEVHADPSAAAARALAAIEDAAAPFVVHCDVDVLDFADAPFADVPDSGGGNAGLSVDELMASLAVFTASEGFAGFVLTEINPDHVPEITMLHAFIDRLATTLAG